MTDVTRQEAKQAYQEAIKAKNKLTRAANTLGFDNTHELAQAAQDEDFSRQLDDGAKAITNAYSYLDNGQLEGLLRAFEDEE